MRTGATKDLGRLVFMVLKPALLLRAMSRVHVEQLNSKSVAAFLTSRIALFLLMWALAATFSNMVAIRLPLKMIVVTVSQVMALAQRL